MATKRKRIKFYPDYNPYLPKYVEYIVQPDGVSVYDRYGNHVGDFESEAEAREEMYRTFFKQYAEV